MPYSEYHDMFEDTYSMDLIMNDWFLFFILCHAIAACSTALCAPHFCALRFAHRACALVLSWHLGTTPAGRLVWTMDWAPPRFFLFSSSFYLPSPTGDVHLRPTKTDCMLEVVALSYPMTAIELPLWLYFRLILASWVGLIPKGIVLWVLDVLAWEQGKVSLVLWPVCVHPCALVSLVHSLYTLPNRVVTHVIGIPH